VDLHYGTSEYAVLASFGFTAVFAAASLLAGRLADTTVRLRARERESGPGVETPLP
jgi:hypothetical protein